MQHHEPRSSPTHCSSETNSERRLPLQQNSVCLSLLVLTVSTSNVGDAVGRVAAVKKQTESLAIFLVFDIYLVQYIPVYSVIVILAKNRRRKTNSVGLYIRPTQSSVTLPLAPPPQPPTPHHLTTNIIITNGNSITASQHHSNTVAQQHSSNIATRHHSKSSNIATQQNSSTATAVT